MMTQGHRRVSQTDGQSAYDLVGTVDVQLGETTLDCKFRTMRFTGPLSGDTVFAGMRSRDITATSAFSGSPLASSGQGIIGPILACQ